MRRLRVAGAVVVAVLCASSAAACSTPVSGSPVPETASTEASTEPGASSAPEAAAVDPALAVANPLDVTHLRSEPCRALSAEQREQLGLTDGEVREGSPVAGEACLWTRLEESLDSTSLNVLFGNENGITALYAQRDRTEYFEPTEVGGYPAVFSSLVDHRDSGICDLWVGVNDREVLHLMTNFASSVDPSTPCRTAADVAEAAVATLAG